MKKLNALMEEHERLKKILESKGYSGIKSYERVPLRRRMLCRLIQLVWATYVILRILNWRNVCIDGFWSATIMQLIWCLIVCMGIGWYFRNVMSRTSTLEYLSVNGYLAKLKMQIKVKKLQMEITRLDTKECELEPILQKFAKVAAIIEDQLGGRTRLIKEVGENPYFRALIVRDEVLAKIVQPRECGFDEGLYGGSDYVRLVYDVTREGAFAELSYNVAILLEWKKTKFAEEEIARKHAVSLESDVMKGRR